MFLPSLAGNVEFCPKSIFRSECSSITRSEAHRTASQQHKLLNIDHKLLNIKHKLLNMSQKSLNTSSPFKFLSNSSLKLQIWVKLTERGSMSLPSLACDVQIIPAQYPNQILSSILIHDAIYDSRRSSLCKSFNSKYLYFTRMNQKVYILKNFRISVQQKCLQLDQDFKKIVSIRDCSASRN